MRPWPPVVLPLALAACATGPQITTSADYAPVRLSDAPPNAALYVGCIGQAIERGRVRRAFDDTTELLVFACDGAPARAFFDALGPRSARVGSEVALDGAVLRTTEPIRRDLFGADGCRAAADGAVTCTISLRTGDFLTETPGA
ncbi:hypothetical protein [Brevundimonas balnearis]|uniref:Lipoprotein n=1 Tax=Brevundimonas balnearis TaxID=1572858 RepID=A0ABV6QYY5_9CAUL